MPPKNHLTLLLNKRFSAFIEFALFEGWHIKISPKGNIQLKRKGYTPIYNAGFLLEKASYKTEQSIKYPHQKKEMA